MHKRLVAGLSRLVTCLQSNFIGTNFTGFSSNLGICGLFSSPFVSYWAHIGWLSPGSLMGAGNPTISGETETQVPAACQPWQPHITPCLCFYGRPNHGSFISSVGTIKYWDLSNIRWMDSQCVFLNNSPLRDFILKMLFGNWGRGLSFFLEE